MRAPIAILIALAFALHANGEEWSTLSVDSHGLVHENRPNPRYVPAPPWYEPGLASKTGAITVNYNASSCPAGSIAWTQAAQDAFQKAVDIWSSILNTTQTITIDACWVNTLGATILGSTQSLNSFRNFNNAPLQNTWYVVSLANQFAETDLDSGNSDMLIQFNSNFDWFLGLGAQDTDDQPNFVTVVLHEIAHGLGFAGRMRVDDGITNPNNPQECNGTSGVGCWGTAGANPRIYDRFTENDAGTPILNFANNSTALGNELTSDDVFFDGPTANILNGGDPPELYAPTTWDPGSSYSHLGEGFNDTDNALMTFSTGDGEVIHHPGIVTLGLLQDLGWDLRNLGSVWVDGSYGGVTQVGSPGFPFDTVFEGIHAVYPGGNVFVEAGSYDEELEMTNALLLQGINGTVVIGQ